MRVTNFLFFFFFGNSISMHYLRVALQRMTHEIEISFAFGKSDFGS